MQEGTLEERVRGIEVMQCIKSMREGTWKAGDPLYGALDLHTPSLRTLKIESPLEFSGHSPTNFVRKDENKFHPWDGVVVPMGSITQCHIDEWALSIFFLHVSGRKLWLIWPPTVENLKTYAKDVTTTGKLLTVTEAIDRLDGLQLLYLENSDQISWNFPPGTLHAVITFSPVATHVGYFLAKFEDFEHVKNITKIYLDTLFEAKEHHQTPDDQAVGEADRTLFEMHNECLGFWMELQAKMRPERPNDAEKIKKWVLTTSRRIRKIVKGRKWMASSGFKVY